MILKPRKRKNKLRNTLQATPATQLASDQSMPLCHEMPIPAPYSSKFWLYTSRVGKFLGYMIEATALVGVFAAYYQFSPNISVSPYPAFRASDPFGDWHWLPQPAIR
jgi:hypothetical protein